MIYVEEASHKVFQSHKALRIILLNYHLYISIKLLSLTINYLNEWIWTPFRDILIVFWRKVCEFKDSKIIQ